MLIADKREWKKEKAALEAMIPPHLKARGWAILTRAGHAHQLSRPWTRRGLVDLPYGLSAAMADLQLALDLAPKEA